MKHPIYSMSFSDAVLRELSIERDEKKVKETSVFLPKWMRTPIDILHIESKMSVAKLYTGIVNHGTSILQHRFDDEINAFQHVRRAILRSGNTFHEALLHEFNSIGDATFVKPYRRTMNIPEWCIGYLGKLSDVFPIEYSASIRMSIYYSLNRWDDIPTWNKSMCLKEIDTFEKGVNENDKHK